QIPGMEPLSGDRDDIADPAEHDETRARVAAPARTGCPDGVARVEPHEWAPVHPERGDDEPSEVLVHWEDLAVRERGLDVQRARRAGRAEEHRLGGSVQLDAPGAPHAREPPL